MEFFQNSSDFWLETVKEFRCHQQNSDCRNWKTPKSSVLDWFFFQFMHSKFCRWQWNSSRILVGKIWLTWPRSCIRRSTDCSEWDQNVVSDTTCFHISRPKMASYLGVFQIFLQNSLDTTKVYKHTKGRYLDFQSPRFCNYGQMLK